MFGFPVADDVEASDKAIKLEVYADTFSLINLRKLRKRDRRVGYVPRSWRAISASLSSWFVFLFFMDPLREDWNGRVVWRMPSSLALPLPFPFGIVVKPSTLCVAALNNRQCIKSAF
jgi:hypothetical protein